MINKKYFIILYFSLLILLLVFYFYNIHTKIKTHIGDNFSAKVIKAIDVNTIYIVNKDNKNLKLKFANIYFPKKDMLGWNESFKIINKELVGNEIKVKIVDKDKFNVFLAIIYLNDEDFNYYLVTKGCAWHFKRYARLHQSKLDYIKYHEAEKLAKDNKQCLWHYQMYKFSNQL